MQFLKRLHEESIRWAKRAQGFRQAAFGAMKQWRQQAVLDEAEAERLDRIRNPSKYLGKS